jgi:hypothetical protein
LAVLAVESDREQLHGGFHIDSVKLIVLQELTKKMNLNKKETTLDGSLFTKFKCELMVPAVFMVFNFFINDMYMLILCLLGHRAQFVSETSKRDAENMAFLKLASDLFPNKVIEHYEHYREEAEQKCQTRNPDVVQAPVMAPNVVQATVMAPNVI